MLLNGENLKEHNDRAILRLKDKLGDSYGLDDVLDKITSLHESNDFKKYAEKREDIIDCIENDGFVFKNLEESIFKKYPRLLDTSVLKRSSLIKFGFKVSGLDIYFNHYENLFIYIATMLTLKKKEFPSYDEIFYFVDRAMTLLSNFDEDCDFKAPDKDFFIMFKKIVWNKRAFKLFKEIIYSILYDNIDYIISNNPQIHNKRRLKTEIKLQITFLIACSTITNKSNRIVDFDVICGFKTYFKLLNSEYTMFKIK